MSDVNDYVVSCDDCTSWIRKIPDKSVDMVFTDPPYGHNNNGDLISMWESALGRGMVGPSRPIANDGPEANDLFRRMLPEMHRVMKPGSAICVCCGGGGGPDPMFARWSHWLDEVFAFKQMVVWDKGPMGMGWHYRRSYEVVLVASKGPKCNWYDESNAVENIIRPGYRGIRKIIPRADQHPTEKPPELAHMFIDLHTKEGDTVIDPFAGHGSTGVACKRAGRKFLGCEIDPGFAEKARSAIRAASRVYGQGNGPLDGLFV